MNGMGFLEDLHSETEWTGTESYLNMCPFTSRVRLGAALELGFIETPNFVEDYKPGDELPERLQLARITRRCAALLIVDNVIAPANQSVVLPAN
ncbi:hypothetical protein BH10PAT3_BH10PAT3_2960 [soil metagenome]